MQVVKSLRYHACIWPGSYLNLYMGRGRREGSISSIATSSLNRSLSGFAEILHRGRAGHSPRPIVHFNNPTPHQSAGTENCCQSFQFRHALQHPYSLKISPCDFFLFEDLKTKLKGEEFETMGELQERTEEWLSQITPDTMQRVYEH